MTVTHGIREEDLFNVSCNGIAILRNGKKKKLHRQGVDDARQRQDNNQ